VIGNKPDKLMLQQIGILGESDRSLDWLSEDFVPCEGKSREEGANHYDT